MLRLKAVAVLAVMLAASSGIAQAGNNGAQVRKGGFMLNVIAFQQCPAGTFLDTNRHEIAVQANFTGVGTDKTLKVNKIFLRAGDDFWVQDGNACDDGAYFYLPITAANCANCTDPTVVPTFTQYEVRARILGKPGGSVRVTSCVEATMIDPVTGAPTLESLCSVGDTNIFVQTRNVGTGKDQNRWANVSSQLLTVCIDTSGDGVCDKRVPLFDASGTDYWWNWDTTGKPHVQLVFFPVASGAR